MLKVDEISPGKSKVSSVKYRAFNAFQQKPINSRIGCSISSFYTTWTSSENNVTKHTENTVSQSYVIRFLLSYFSGDCSKVKMGPQGL